MKNIIFNVMFNIVFNIKKWFFILIAVISFFYLISSSFYEDEIWGDEPDEPYIAIKR